MYFIHSLYYMKLLLFTSPKLNRFLCFYFLLFISSLLYHLLGFPRWLGGKESPAKAGDRGSIPGLGRSPGGENGNPVSCLENSMGRAWWATVHRVAKELEMTERLSLIISLLL